MAGPVHQKGTFHVWGVRSGQVLPQGATIKILQMRQAEDKRIIAGNFTKSTRQRSVLTTKGRKNEKRESKAEKNDRGLRTMHPSCRKRVVKEKP